MAEIPALDWLRKQAKQRLRELRLTDPSAKLADVQFALAKEHGFASWRALKAHADAATIDGQLIDAAKQGDAVRLRALLDAHPERLHLRAKPYEWTLLHFAATHVPALELLLQRGLDVNVRERGDNTYAMHWAAAAGALDAVRILADAGGDVVGAGDDHELQVIGWATCWQETDDEAHRAVARFLVSRGARHHIFSAVAMNLADEVRRIVADDASALNRRQSRNENHRTPLHFAVLMHRAEMVNLLLELGADPLAVDGSGQTVAAYSSDPVIDRPVMQRIAAMVAAELDSADRGQRTPRAVPADLAAVLTLADWSTAAVLATANGALLSPASGVLHLMAQRNDVAGVEWLLAHGADINGRWSGDGPLVTPLHLAAQQGHVDMIRLLLERGADPGIHDSMHDSTPLGWAHFFKHREAVEVLQAAGAS